MRRLLVPLTIALAISTLGGVGATAVFPATVHVEARAEYYVPSTVTLRQGGEVTWDFTDSHTATDVTPLALYDSGIIHDTSFSHTFTAAGTYPFVCTIHTGMDGVVKVPTTAKPGTGPRGTAFTVTWASTAAPLGYVYDVQRRRGSGAWVMWRNGTTERSGTFTPTRKGTVRFRSRLRDDGGAAASGWSVPVRLTVG